LHHNFNWHNIFKMLICKQRDIKTRLTRRVPPVEQELPTLPEHLSSPSVFSGVHVTRSLVLCVMFCRSLFVLLAILLSVLRFTDSNYPLISSNSSWISSHLLVYTNNRYLQMFWVLTSIQHLLHKTVSLKPSSGQLSDFHQVSGQWSKLTAQYL